jgi:COP9 signalosome complex subunit 1
MALSIEQSAYFSERRASGALVVPDAPKFDLESYAANYDGMQHVQRRLSLNTRTS